MNISDDLHKGFCLIYTFCFVAGGLFFFLLWKVGSYLLHHLKWI